MEIKRDIYLNKQFRDLEVLYPYLKEQIKDDGMYYVLLIVNKIARSRE